MDANPEESKQIYFSLDVNPVQKDAHLSDQFHQRDPDKPDGRICRVQGKKLSESSRASKWPCIYVSHRNFDTPHRSIDCS